MFDRPGTIIDHGETTVRFKKIAAAGAVVAATLAGTVATSGSAQAAGHNGVCEAEEMCMYWGGNLSGSFHDYFYSTSDFGGDVFLSGGSGQGERVKNNSASAYNRWSLLGRVYYNENFSGSYDDVPAYGSVNLVRTWNDNASFNWV
ncbi:peptidase inhibitor family I36 protein [Streptomyces sp. NPDC006285]|uniref:peptidase inhibitor family I36 protein n=1 Tax=Streptomyces sp. NPDC006285 TaxID=3364742 RepID=UPI0036B2013D